MTNDAMLKSSTSGSSGLIVKTTIFIAAIWTVGIAVLAGAGVFDVPADMPTLPTLFAIAAPVVAFAAAVRLSPRLRGIVLVLDPVLLTEIQAWRILGGLFLAVYAFGHLPGIFAWPAGLGDVAIGLAAPFMAWRLRADERFLTKARFRWFNYLGLADFGIAVGVGVAARSQIPGLVDAVTTSAMGQLPLVLIPTVAVPGFIILHLIVLMQINNRRR